MKFKPNPRQVLYLRKLLVSGEGIQFGLTTPLKNASERNELEKNGLIEIPAERKKTPKGSLAKYVLLSEKGWLWNAENMEAEISRSYEAATVLRQLFCKLKDYLEDNEIALATVFMPNVSSGTDSSNVVEATQAENLQDIIREAYCRLSGGKWNSRVRLRDLRQALPTFSRSDVDSVLLSMEDERKLVLYDLDDPQEITPEDTAAAVEVVPGIKRHIIYMEG